MFKFIARLLGVLLISYWSVTAGAMLYQASFTDAEWRLKASKFECRLWQPVPHFGDAVFANRAGEELRFYLSPISQMMKPGQASLMAKPPLWDESRDSIDMGLVKVRDTKTPISLGKNHASQLLNQLYRGMAPEFTRTSLVDQNEKIRLALSSVNFRRAYGQYSECLNELLPVNFDQIQRSRLRFVSSDFELTPSSKRRLEHIIQYIKADPAITGFYVDGHTDSLGRRLENLELSKGRAEAVTRYLVANGVDEALITTRYHGERYPVVSNDTAKNRAMNRRVTLRLEREGV